MSTSDETAENPGTATPGDATETPGPCVVGIVCGNGSEPELRAFFAAVSGTTAVSYVVVPVGEHGTTFRDAVTIAATLPIVDLDATMRIEPRTIYFVNPETQVALRDGELVVSSAETASAAPADHFLRTLAVEKRERAIAVILSGPGVDGTLGARAIEEHGGVSLVQTPHEGSIDSMLRSVLQTGAIDYAIPAEAMPAVIDRYTAHPYVKEGSQEASQEAVAADDATELERVLTILRARIGHNFHCYKRSTLGRRIRRRMGLKEIATLAEYAEYLESMPGELEELFRDMLICVTEFFRDREAWAILRAHVLSEIVRRKRSDETIRVWVAGCCTGEEAYTVAILLADELRAQGRPNMVQIFASDVSHDALETARLGLYPRSIAADVPAEYLERYFVELAGDDHYAVSKQIRESVIFAHQDLIGDPPFSKLDLICCRNLLIYLEPEVQHKSMALFHFALREGGFLMLGTAETVGRNSDLFVPISKRWRVYSRADAQRREVVQFPIAAASPRNGPVAPGATRPAAFEPRLSRLAQQLVLDQFAPAAVLVNQSFAILHFSGPTHLYLVQPTGAPTNDLMVLAREGLRSKIRTAAAKAVRESNPVTIDGVRFKSEQTTRSVRISVIPVRTEHTPEPLLLVVFEDERQGPERAPIAKPSPDARTDEGAVRQLEYELQVTREELQSHIEELETSNEELKASNEEVMSINEELQSTNEELETSKEELQSLNEELATVNQQMHEKLEELEQVNNDLDNLLSSTDIATLFLDRSLRIKRFTPAMRRLLNIIPTDIGRPIADFTRRFSDVDLLDDAKQVLERLVPAELEVRTDDDRWYLRRIVTYRTEDNRIDGVVITFVDITERRSATEALRSAEDRYRLLIEATIDFAIFMIDPDGRIQTWNSGAERICGFSEREAVGKSSALIFIAEDRATHEAEKELERARRDGRSEDERWHLRKDGTRYWGSGVVTAIFDEAGVLQGYAKVMRDQTDRRRMESELKQLNESLEQMVSERTAALRALSSELLLAEERERRDLASDLHDSIGQALALAAMRLKERAKESAGDERPALAEVIGLIDQANQSVRSITMQLSPPILYQLGLVPAIEWLAEEMERRYALNVVLEARNVPEQVDDRVRFILFRSARELLINVSKHANVTDARVRIGSAGDSIVLEVEDNGHGFEATGDRISRRESGFGLFSIRERLGYIGGEVIIRSTPGLGTTVVLRAPNTIHQSGSEQNDHGHTNPPRR